MKRPMSSIRLYMSVCISCCWTGFQGFSSKPCSVILIAKAQARWAPPALTSVSCMHERRSNCLLYWTTLHWSKPYPDQDRLRMLASYTCKTRQQVRLRVGGTHSMLVSVVSSLLLTAGTQSHVLIVAIRRWLTGLRTGEHGCGSISCLVSRLWINLHYGSERDANFLHWWHSSNYTTMSRSIHIPNITRAYH